MEDKKEIIQELEEILRGNSASPVFARLAALYIESGEYLHALALCDRGTGTYPEYATGFLLRASALQHLEKYDESIENYKKVLDILPRCSVAGKKLEELQKKVVEAEQTDIQETEEDKPDTGFIEDLAERLKGYKPERPGEELKHMDPLEIKEEEGSDLPIVSETLANIFFRQKQYDRAVEAYRLLIKRNPEKADIYLTKIKQVEEAKKEEQ